MFAADGVHRVFGPDLVKQFCPSSAKIISEVTKKVYNNKAINFGNEVYISVERPTVKLIHKWDNIKRCGLSSCKKVITLNCAYSYCAIIYPETHLFSAFPFTPISDFPSKRGLTVCHHHCLISSDTSLAPFLDNIPKVVFMLLIISNCYF